MASPQLENGYAMSDQEPSLTELAAQGRSLIPCQLNKKPCLKTWKEYQTERPTLEQLKAWNSQHCPAGWAMITGLVSRVITLDFDGETAERSMRLCGLEPHRRSGGGGFHVDFEWPGFRVNTLNSKSKEELGKRYPGIDIRGDGGYVVIKGRNENGLYQNYRNASSL